MVTGLKKILIAGAGQLGSRHLQGLAKTESHLSIYVLDVSSVALDRTRNRWSDAGGLNTSHRITYIRSADELSEQLDLAIVATVASERPEAVRGIARRSQVKAWILEKVLAQSESAIDELVSTIGNSSRAWVNTPRRIVPWHKEIQSSLMLKTPIVLSVKGGAWGLMCNSIHFLDLLAWWTGEQLKEIRTDKLDKKWFEGKRAGNWEIFGEMEAVFSHGSRAILSASDGEVHYQIAASDGSIEWSIDEFEGIARRSDGLEIEGRIPFQSEMSGTLVENILKRGCCELPTLGESAQMHTVLIGSLLEHWKNCGHTGAALLPIT